MILLAAALGGPAAGDPLELPSVASDAWLRTGPSTSHSRINGLPRGTVVLVMDEIDTTFQPLGRRWVHIHVLEGRAAGRDGWVWGEFIRCCEQREWLDASP